MKTVENYLAQLENALKEVGYLPVIGFQDHFLHAVTKCTVEVKRSRKKDIFYLTFFNPNVQYRVSISSIEPVETMEAYVNGMTDNMRAIELRRNYIAPIFEN